jgi:Zn-dependent protease with chaperone function
MIVPYALRLLCLCLASFFVVNAAARLAAGLASRAIVRMAETMRPRSAARVLFGVRVLPCVLGAGAVLFFCVPSYLWLEPQSTSERMGWVCLTLALLGAAGWLGSFARVARALAASVRFRRACQEAGCTILLLDESSTAVIVNKDGPLLALVGLFRPRLIISDALVRSLSLEELQVALLHENAHRDSRDNLKRLALLLAPAPIPFFRVFSSLEHSWAKLSEWAADDEAVRGDSERALSLATALLRVARMMGTAPRLSFLHTSLCAGDHDLSARVDRLLALQPAPAKALSRTRTVAIGSSFGTAACIALFLTWPATLSSVHRLLELFLR